MSAEDLREEFIRYTKEYFEIQKSSNSSLLNNFTKKLNHTIEEWSRKQSIDDILRPLIRDSSSEVRFLSSSYLIKYCKDEEIINVLLSLKNDKNPHISIFSPIVIDVNK
ncbi:hypothetical protein [Comamonas sp. 4034]|uniref:hypothetical protein n=1 Tax=Comamonas sp. 4034 TaxID=3156455 RepID=UPI003D241A2B